MDTLMIIWNIASLHCSARPEISPCTCEPMLTQNRIALSCEKVDSFNQIVDALAAGKFSSNLTISLEISYSQLDDLEMRSFSEMKLNLYKLRMTSDSLRTIPEMPFRGLSNLEYLGLAENELDEIPRHVLHHLPKTSTLDLGKNNIKAVLQDDFKGNPKITFLILVSNNIARLDKGTFPTEVKSLHLGRNQITTLNGTLLNLPNLESLFINMNNIQSLENELPVLQNLKFILAQNNSLEKLPQSMRDMPNLDSLFFQNNQLKSLDGVLRNAKKLKELKVHNNKIEYLAQDEFLEVESLEIIDMAYNNIKSLNNSLLPMKSLIKSNFSFNEMEVFSMNEIRGLEYLRELDISYNRIQKLTGRQENRIDSQSFLVELYLDRNQLRSLDGALSGLNKLRKLMLTHNQIERIDPEDFIGLESLDTLDLSHNQLLTLEDTSTTVLPSLKTIRVEYNNLTKLEKDFHGLPVLCHANLMHNQITSVSAELVSKTKCSNHGVPGRLEIWLEHNPIMCEFERVNELCPIMSSQEASIRGKSQCYENDREVCSETPLLLQATYSDNLPLILKSGQMFVAVPINPIPFNPKPMKKVDLLPAIISPSNSQYIKALPAPPPLISALSPTSTTTTSTTTTLPTTTTSTTTTTTTTTTPAPAPLEIEIETVTQRDILSAHQIPLQHQEDIIQAVIPLQHPTDFQTDYPTIEYVPLPEEDSGQSNFSDGEDNSVQEVYSPVVIPSLENSQRRLMQEEPPETP
ncbi:protein artichoke [Eupeodes corollae]|uniref:protein artichoke n=1 Tax=Eupeodes corollae TaxID=290404 RepID=UPI0024903BF8|nr:protein artichoke [Eupeodes corollae]